MRHSGSGVLKQSLKTVQIFSTILLRMMIRLQDIALNARRGK